MEIIGAYIKFSFQPEVCGPILECLPVLEK